MVTVGSIIFLWVVTTAIGFGSLGAMVYAYNQKLDYVAAMLGMISGGLMIVGNIVTLGMLFMAPLDYPLRPDDYVPAVMTCWLIIIIGCCAFFFCLINLMRMPQSDEKRKRGEE
jgi:Na+/melibiose symporter-like transporter